MKSPLPSLLLVSSIVFAPFAAVAQTAPTASVAKEPALTPAQINQGFKSGLTTIVNQALTPTAIKVPAPKLFAEAEAPLVKANKAAIYQRFNAALTETVNKTTPRAAELIKNAVKDLKIEDATPLLSGSSDAGTQFLRKAVQASVREALLPIIKQAATGAGLAVKAREVFSTLDAAGVKGGAKAISDLEEHVYKQVIDQSFKQIAQREAAVRAQPDLLTGNALGQKVFALAKK
ncbi:MAG: DUF4197 family protein [Rariglobus sp.]